MTVNKTSAASSIATIGADTNNKNGTVNMVNDIMVSMFYS